MADYYQLIATAVSGLDKSTDEARSALYDRARNTLVAQLRGVEPPRSAQEITRELLALEQALLKVEAKAVAQLRPRERQQHKRPTDYYPYLVEGLNSLETNTDEARSALYDHVRNALASQLRGVEPPLSPQEITRERLALEQALLKVEAEAAQRQREKEAKRRAKEERHQREEAMRKPEEERRQREEEAKRKAQDERRQREEDAMRKVEEERRQREEEAKRKAQDERRQREEEVKRKAEQERQPHAIRARLAEAASPAPSLTTDGRLDAGSNPVCDIPTGDDNLPLLPLRQRALIKTLLAGLPQQTPAQLKASLHNYDDELKARGVRPILGLLKDMAEIIEADLGAQNARREWLDEGMLKAFTRFAENNALFMKHCPLDPKREELYLKLSVDEDNASWRALSKRFEDVAKSTLNANKVELTTDDLLKIVDELAEFVKVTLMSITNEPAAKSNTNPHNE
jgi:hypothetical protein